MDGPGDANGPWTIIGSTGDFDGLAGDGLWSGRSGDGFMGLGTFRGAID